MTVTSTDEVVAEVAGQTLLASDVRRRVSSLRRGPDGLRLPAPGTPESERLARLVAHELITERLIRHEATRAGLDVATPEEAAAQLRSHVAADVAVDDAEVARFHAANPDRFVRPPRRRLRHLVVERRRLADALAAAIRGGEDLGVLARAWSEDRGSRDRGGDLGWVVRGELTGAIEQAAFGAPRGVLLGPIRTGFGWHLVRVEAIDEGGPVPLERARAAIERHLTDHARAAAFDRWLGQRRRELVSLRGGWAHPADPRSDRHSHRH